MEEIKNLQKIKEMASYCKFYFYEVFVFTYMKKKNISTLFAAWSRSINSAFIIYLLYLNWYLILF